MNFAQRIRQIDQIGANTSNYDDATGNLGNIPGLSADLISGKTYLFVARLYVTPDLTGGSKYDNY